MANNISDKISVSSTLTNLMRKGLWEGYFDKETNTVRDEKFVKHSNFPN
jgi:hypothetical protein